MCPRRQSLFLGGYPLRICLGVRGQCYDAQKHAIGLSQRDRAILGRVDKRDSQKAHALIQECFLRSSHGPRGFVGCGVGVDWAAVAA